MSTYRSNLSGSYVYVEASLGGTPPEAWYPAAGYDVGSLCWDKTGKLLYVCQSVSGTNAWVLIGERHVGAATLDFSAAPGPHARNNVTVTITGQTGIVAGSLPSATVPYAATSDHTADEHAIAPIRLACGNIVPGVGFDIVAVSEWLLAGQFNVSWTWV